MEIPRFSVFEAIVYAFKTIFDNIRLFVLAFLAKMAFFLSFFLIFGLFTINIIKKIWEQWSEVVELTKSTSIESFKMSGEQLWATISGLLSNYIIVFFIFAIIFLFLWLGIYLGFIRIVLRLHDTGSSSVKLLFSCFGLAPKVFIATILFGLMVGFGLLLFVIPGIYFMLRGLFFPYFIVDKNAGIIDSIKKSFEVTKGQVWPLFGLVLIAPLMLRFGPAGLFAITPLITASQVYVYRKIV